MFVEKALDYEQDHMGAPKVDPTNGFFGTLSLSRILNGGDFD